MRDVVEALASSFSLTDDERQEMLPSGQSKVFNNRVGWAKTHLKNAGLVDNPTRGKVRLSDRGRQVLAQNPASIDMKFLRQYDGYRSFIGEIQSDEAIASDSDQDRESIKTTPLEQFEASFSTLRAALAEELQSRLIECSPQFFEHIVVKLLHAMGYGGQFGEGRVTNYSHDDRARIHTRQQFPVNQIAGVFIDEGNQVVLLTTHFQVHQVGSPDLIRATRFLEFFPVTFRSSSLTLHQVLFP